MSVALSQTLRASAASRPAAAAPTRRRRLPATLALVVLGYALALGLLADVALKVF